MMFVVKVVYPILEQLNISPKLDKMHMPALFK